VFDSVCLEASGVFVCRDPYAFFVVVRVRYFLWPRRPTFPPFFDLENGGVGGWVGGSLAHRVHCYFHSDVGSIQYCTVEPLYYVASFFCVSFLPPFWKREQKNRQKPTQIEI